MAKPSKKATETYKNWVRRTVRNLLDYFFLSHWSIDLCWEKDFSNVDGNTGVVAHIDVSGNYYQAAIHMLPTAQDIYQDGDIDRLVLALVHEFCHILTEPLYEIAVHGVTSSCSNFLETVREQQTQHIAVIVMRNLPKKLYS